DHRLRLDAPRDPPRAVPGGLVRSGEGPPDVRTHQVPARRAGVARQGGAGDHEVMRTLRGLVGGLVALLVAGCLAGSDGATAAQNELALAPVLPGAVEVFSSPTRALDDGFTDMVIDVNRWWTAPGTVDGAVAYLQGHPPPTMVAGGIGRSSGGGTG